MAHKKAGGSSRNGRDSESKRLGVKKFGGRLSSPATSSCASAAPSWYPGNNVGMGKDHTSFALTDGCVAFRDGKLGRKFVHVMPASAEAKHRNGQKGTVPTRGGPDEILTNDRRPKGEEGAPSSPFLFPKGPSLLPKLSRPPAIGRARRRRVTMFARTEGCC
jgi:large subunit ribosomal protein L27